MNTAPARAAGPCWDPCPDLARDLPGFWIDLASRHGTVAAFRSGVKPAIW